jgi:hypothetical protein
MITIGKATLHNCDCMTLLKETPDKFYEASIKRIKQATAQERLFE